MRRRGGGRTALAAGALALLAACGGGEGRGDGATARHPNQTPELRMLVEDVSRRNGVPYDLVHRVVASESGYDPAARNGPYYGLMQIHPQTAATMGYDGRAEGLLDPRTNLTYGVKYLRGAWLVADGDRERAIGWYRRGYYYEAKRKGLLEETGLR